MVRRMPQRFRFGPFELDASRGVVTRDGSVLSLGGRALSVLQALVTARGNVVTKAELMAAAWPGAVVEEANLSVQIAALRKLIGSVPGCEDWIATVSRVGYRFSGPLQLEEPSGLVADKPSIVVLPFTNLSGEPSQEYFVDGITEDIINVLARFRWFFVVARNSSFALKGRAIDTREVAHELGVRYVLEGSVRKAGERIRIAAALNDAGTGNRIWAERYEFALTDMFSVQDEMVQRVVGAIEPQLLKSEARLAMGKRGGDLSTWDLVRQGTHCFHKVTRELHLRARELFRQAAAREAELPDAHIWLARVSAGIVAYGWSSDPQADLREGVAAAFEAIRRDEQSPYSYYALAITSVYAGESTQAIRAAQRALELTPSFALGYLVLGLSHLFAGEPRAAIQPLEHGLTLNAHDPQNFVWYNMLAFARYFAGEPAKALEAAQRALDIRQEWRPAVQLIACCNMVLGHADRAAQSIQHAKRMPPPNDLLLEPLMRNTRLWNEGIEPQLRQLGA
ncbi:MAG TPA: winged helix-turn-helix domain-containing protein [Burkholderiales bacterium]|nr:winged helix-turn-helix domain-containing protein [Burkholderiales bacterium]